MTELGELKAAELFRIQSSSEKSVFIYSVFFLFPLFKVRRKNRP